MKLYELTSNYTQLLEVLDSEQDLDKQALQDTLDSIEEIMEVKIENCAKLILSLSAEAKKFEAEAQRLLDKKKAYQNKMENVKAYVLNNMVTANKPKIKTAVGNVRVQKNSQMTVNLLDEKAIPKKYWTIPAPVVSKSAILADFKAGEKIPGAEVSTGFHLRIQ